MINVSSYCPLCKSSLVKFMPLPEFYRECSDRYGFAYYGKAEMTAELTYSCSRCGCSDRERLYAYWLDQALSENRLKQGMKIIHFAPEPIFSQVLRSSNMFDYSTADLMMPNADYKLDMLDMPFPDGMFDFFICSHVLEHVADDAKAIDELYRVTKKGGCGILMAPIIIDLENTLEVDPPVTCEAERWRLYGQDDHVRLYAHDDYVDKIKNGGFAVEQYGIDYFGVDVFAMLGLKNESILYVARK
jgi:SAM-dependent methyltransferase